MLRDVNQFFSELLKATELGKVDFKRDQYRLDNDDLKSRFVKDILCMANAAGGDGYVLLGIKTEKGRPLEVVGIAYHHDSSDLEATVNGIIDQPIQFEYYPLNHKGLECALLHIPPSKAKPHWAKRDFGIIKKHVIYTRRSSGNREASIQEVREMGIETIRVSDIAQRKAKSSPHVIDELVNMSLDDRELVMHRMLKSIASKIGLTRYREIFSPTLTKHICTLVVSAKSKVVRDYAIFMYPWTARMYDIMAARRYLTGLVVGSGGKRVMRSTQMRLRGSALIHICYKGIHTKALERRLRMPGGLWFANEWSEPWGRVMKWEDIVPQKRRNKIVYRKMAEHEFFLPDVTSKTELRDRLVKLLAWVDSNIT